MARVLKTSLKFAKEAARVDFLDRKFPSEIILSVFRLRAVQHQHDNGETRDRNSAANPFATVPAIQPSFHAIPQQLEGGDLKHLLALAIVKVPNEVFEVVLVRRLLPVQSDQFFDFFDLFHVLSVVLANGGSLMPEFLQIVL